MVLSQRAIFGAKSKQRVSGIQLSYRLPNSRKSHVATAPGRVSMPTVKVVIKKAVDHHGKMITKRYPLAQARIHPTTNVLQVYRSHGPSGEDEEILAEFQPETYLYWE